MKPTFLAQHGHEILNPTLPDDNFEVAVRIGQAEFEQHQLDVVVGSSRGGAVAMKNDSRNALLVLLCPAWKRWSNATTVERNTIILHSRADGTVPFADSEEVVKNSGLSESALSEVGDDHRLADQDSFLAIQRACQRGVG